MLTSQRLNYFQNELQNRKKELNSQLEQNDHYDLDRAHAHESMGELSSYDNHPADQGTELYEREKDIALNEHSEKELKDINHALNRIKDGTYGICEKCGNEISSERLEALPTAVHCKEHTPEQEISGERPVEEEVLMPDFGKFELDEEDATTYDSEDSWQDVARYGTSETPSDFAARDIEYYSQAYTEADEPVSYVEEIEAFAGNDIDGKNVKVYPANSVHKEYEQRLDDEGLMSIIGDIPYTETEGYVDEEDH